MKAIRILLVEDNRILREGIAAMLKREKDVRLVAAAGGHENILALARRYRPRVVLLDLGVRNLNGTSLVAALTNAQPGIMVIGMGLLPTQRDIIESVQAGAAGFILKDASMADVLGTIRSVAGGTKVLPPS
ncbi:MAG TPA: response regulator transcription factor, partial [Bacteroidota bacterium]|nr:response regulator transcription factor [Bacteroidota bacterium]